MEQLKNTTKYLEEDKNGHVIGSSRDTIVPPYTRLIFVLCFYETQTNRWAPQTPQTNKLLSVYEEFELFLVNSFHRLKQ